MFVNGKTDIGLKALRLTREEIASLDAAGAVGDVLCHFINEDGELVDHPVND